MQGRQLPLQLLAFRSGPSQISLRLIQLGAEACHLRFQLCSVCQLLGELVLHEVLLVRGVRGDLSERSNLTSHSHLGFGPTLQLLFEAAHNLSQAGNLPSFVAQLPAQVADFVLLGAGELFPTSLFVVGLELEFFDAHLLLLDALFQAQDSLPQHLRFPQMFLGRSRDSSHLQRVLVKRPLVDFGVLPVLQKAISDFQLQALNNLIPVIQFLLHLGPHMVRSLQRLLQLQVRRLHRVHSLAEHGHFSGVLLIIPSKLQRVTQRLLIRGLQLHCALLLLPKLVLRVLLLQPQLLLRVEILRRLSIQKVL
mmetsp:Transcript_9590/g.21541  ORF Transcript_9590/g.21541 Transcript_9590/m.21541 type:complete len:308 (-) Transcript_9590:147-1070(-)